MKIKQSFITKSRSCSFVLIGKEIKTIEELEKLTNKENCKVYNGENFCDLLDYDSDNEKKYDYIFERKYKVFDTIFYERIYYDDPPEECNNILRIPEGDYVIITGTECC